MFSIKCDFKVLGSTNAKVNLYVLSDEETEQLMSLINKEESYKEYLKQVKDIVNTVSKELGELTIKFAVENISDQGINQENTDENMKKLLREVLKEILGGNE